MNKLLLATLVCTVLTACNTDNNSPELNEVKITNLDAFQGLYDLDGDAISDISPGLDEGRWTVDWTVAGKPQVMELRISDGNSLDAPLYLNNCNQVDGCSDYALNCTVNNNHMLLCDDPAYQDSSVPFVKIGSYPVPLADNLDRLPKTFYLELTVCADNCDTAIRTIRLD